MDLYNKVKDFVFVYKVNLLIGGILFVFIILSNLGIYFLVNNKLKKIDINEEVALIPATEEESNEEEEKLESYKIDIKGAVKNPGVYELKVGSRVIDVIKEAGGLMEGADTSVNNLSKYIEDEMVIVIYTSDEVNNFSSVLEEEQIKEELCTLYNGVINNDGCTSNFNEKENNSFTNLEVDNKISLNTATLELLMTLPGIGEVKAKSIISYREDEGPFEKIEDIMNVSGIGESTFEQIKDYITI